MTLILSMAGNVFWIVALTIMAGASRTAFNTIPRGVAVPMLWDSKRMVIWRAPRALGLTLTILLALAGGLCLLWFARTAERPEAAWIWFGVRVALAPLVALAHLAHLKRAIQTLGAEGRLTP